MKQMAVRLIMYMMVLSVICGCTSNRRKKDTAITMSGVVVTAEQFKKSFSGKPDLREAYDSSNSETAELTISDVVIKEEEISFTAEVEINDTSKKLEVQGKLGSSYKYQQGINSTIAAVPDEINGYRIRLFEIYNDMEADNLLVSTFKDPHIKIYLEDNNQKIYLFESEMPECLNQLNAKDYAPAPGRNDMLWALDLVEHNEKTIEIDSGIDK